MIEDLRSYEEDAPIEADLCVIGAGVAGITLARAFRGRATRVVLLESGGTDFEPAVQALTEGKNLGLPYYELGHSRLHFFGGSTAVWGGRCVAHDGIDFERREWVPWSGWPFPKSELDPYYERAQRELGLGEPVYDERAWSLLGAEVPAFDPERVRTGFWQFDPVYWRFGIGSCRDLATAANVRILLHATAIRLSAAPGGGSIRHVEVATPEGRRARVRARIYALAAGGIDNPRLLLASNDVEPAGLGNRHDLVGRFFMEHPHGRAARIEATDPYRLWRWLGKRAERGGTTFAPIIRPGEALQERAGILNTSLALRWQRKPESGLSLHRILYDAAKHRISPTVAGRSLWRVYRAFNGFLRRVAGPVVRYQLARGKSGIYLIARGEQAPNPESRVVLSEERDALGMPKADLDWRLSAIDKRSVAVLVGAIDGEFERLGLGRAIPEPWLADESPAWPVDPTVSKHAIGGYHHMGTTRMADDPKEGVAGGDGRVHGIDNLYVAGSSLFPTAGWANPTLTILALTLRLGDHLRGRLEA